MNNFKGIVQTVQKGVIKHSPEILTGIGISGMVTTTILAVKSTPKALMLIEDKKAEEMTDKLEPIEIVKATWKCYLPSAIIGTFSIFCLIGANSVNSRRNAALATAYSISESAMKTYRDKVVETIGEKKERDVRDAIAKEEVENNPVTTKEIFITEKGNTLCYDALSGRYFKSDIEQMKKVLNVMNNQLLNYNYISLNDFYLELGLEPTKIGDSLGWRIEQGLIQLYFSSQIAEDGTPCIVLDFETSPMYDFDKWL